MVRHVILVHITASSSLATLVLYFRTGRYSGRGIGRLGLGVVKMQEQKIIKTNECPYCGCKEIRYIKRTHGEITYIVYSCTKCKQVIRRELS